MAAIRILIVTHAPLRAELGAAQTAINLAEALQAQGQDVTLWTPHPLPTQTKWWQSIQKMRLNLDSFIETQKPFDVIDSPPALITSYVSKSALIVVARSVQPDILYKLHSLDIQIKSSLRSTVKKICDYFYSWFEVFLVLQGWSRAKYIFCLGNLEFYWMRKWFPWWKSKFVYYVNAPSKADRAALAEVRQLRRQHSGDNIRFLWIGRWAAHKGTDILLSFIVKQVIMRPQDTFTVAGCGVNAEKDFPPEMLQTGKVTILPSFERSHLYSLLASHDIGLFTSRVEGWGLVLNEMLESGMPVSATPVGGVPDLQPFFQNMLIPFPPPSELVINTQLKSESLNSYYRFFDWSQTARLYTKLITNSSNST